MVMTRRAFTAGLGYVLAAGLLPRQARGQAAARRPRVWIAMLYGEADPEGRSRAAAFRQGLENAGWVAGRNVEVDYFWGSFDKDWAGNASANLQKFDPDVVVVNTAAPLGAIRPATGKPIIFIGISEPVAQGFVASLARP